MKKVIVFVLFAAVALVVYQYEKRLPAPVHNKAIDQEAILALSVAMPLSRRSQTEYGGVIYQLNDGYGFTSPQTSNEGAHLAIRVKLLPSAVVVGLYHTHPLGPDSSAFSGLDVSEALDRNVVSYIGVLSNGQIREFIPGKTSILQDPQSGKYSPGDLLTTLTL